MAPVRLAILIEAFINVLVQPGAKRVGVVALIRRDCIRIAGMPRG